MAQESVPAPVVVPTADDHKAVIDAAVATALAAEEAELKPKYQGDVENTVESGWLESTMKLRLKDSHLV